MNSDESAGPASLRRRRLEQVRSRIGRQRLSAGVPAASAAPTAVAAFAASILTAPRAGRPGTAPRLRLGAGRGLRERLAELFAPCLSGSLLPYVSQ